MSNDRSGGALGVIVSFIKEGNAESAVHCLSAMSPNVRRFVWRGLTAAERRILTTCGYKEY